MTTAIAPILDEGLTKQALSQCSMLAKLHSDKGLPLFSQLSRLEAPGNAMKALTVLRLSGVYSPKRFTGSHTFKIPHFLFFDLQSGRMIPAEAQIKYSPTGDLIRTDVAEYYFLVFQLYRTNPSLIASQVARTLDTLLSPGEIAVTIKTLIKGRSEVGKERIKHDGEKQGVYTLSEECLRLELQLRVPEEIETVRSTFTAGQDVPGETARLQAAKYVQELELHTIHDEQDPERRQVQVNALCMSLATASFEQGGTRFMGLVWDSSPKKPRKKEAKT